MWHPPHFSRPQIVQRERGSEASKRKAELKCNMTRSEQRFYEMAVVNAGLPCKRQALIFHDSGYFIADFLLMGKPKIIVEIDGPSHDKHRGYDEWRTRKIGRTRQYGMYQLVRFTNAEVFNGTAWEWITATYPKPVRRAALRRARLSGAA